MDHSSTLIDRLRSHADSAPRRCAIASPGGSVSYAGLLEQVLTQATVLSQAGVVESSVVGIACEDEVQHLVLALALAHLGTTSCTVPTYESPSQQERILQLAGVTHMATQAGRVAATSYSGAGISDGVSGGVSEAASDPVLANVGAKWLFSTSGTTGDPKIVCQLDSGIVAQAHRHVGPTERFACLASMEHNFAKRHRLYCVAEGATNVFLDAAPETLVDQCLAHELTTLHVSAYQAHELLGVPGIGALRGLRLKLGGSHVASSLRNALRDQVTGNLQCGYGTTETGAIAFTAPGDDQAAESVGQPLSGMEVQVVDAQNVPLPTGEQGKLVIRCEGMFLGYLGQPQLTADRLIDGWFHTGDVGRVDDQQRLHLGGRSDDMFVFNSINIHPQDIEAQILESPAVLDAVVVPQPSPVHGDVPVALVVLDDAEAPDLRGLKAFVRARSGVRCPRRFLVVDSIPRNASGKVLRAEAREWVNAGPGR